MAVMMSDRLHSTQQPLRQPTSRSASETINSPKMAHCLFRVIILVLSALTRTHNTNISALNQLNDPVENIVMFLTYTEQSKSRLINRQFNARINRSHSAIQKQLQRVSICVNRIFGVSENSPRENVSEKASDRRQAVHDLNVLEETLFLSEFYITKRPQMLEECMRKHPRHHENISSLYRYSHLQQQKLCGHLTLDAVSKILIYSSRMMLLAMCCVLHSESRAYYQFSAFTARTTWNYLSEYSIDRRLPPLDCLFRLELNPEIFSSDIAELRQMDALGLVIWDPQRLQMASISDPDWFCFFVEKYIRINDWFKHETNYEEEFRWYLGISLTHNISFPGKSLSLSFSL